ncbi:hypothetical protein Leryth_017820 [Lithospermum erythrorhizon]|nr:hypothetical protein Leryth_017820 [Lithospermum erythrorhizon]
MIRLTCQFGIHFRLIYLEFYVYDQQIWLRKLIWNFVCSDYSSHVIMKISLLFKRIH